MSTPNEDRLRQSRLSPARWGESELKRFFELTATSGQSKPTAKGDKGIIVGTTCAFAIRAGVEELRQGGSAVDAVCAAALAEIALTAGCTVSYAGLFHLVYYEKETGKTHALDATYNAPFDEDDPLSIPSRPTPSGRTTLVPGFMAGLEAAHKRFGRLPFASLFEPAIYIAQEGFEVYQFLGWWIRESKDILGRLLETRAIFTKENGELYQRGDHFRQPELADTLGAVAQEGAGHMYTGDWAEAFVNAVQREGGKLTLKDLKAYVPIWSEAQRTDYHGFEVRAARGGVEIIEGLNLLELADHQRHGHYSESADALYWIIQITRMSNLISTLDEDQLTSRFPSLSFRNASRGTKEHARAIWAKLRTPGWLQEVQGILTPRGGHSSGLVAVDAEGNVASVGHTINTLDWGSTGIFVGGISIPDSASIQQASVKEAGPGGRFRNEMNPLVVLKDGNPVLASAAIGAGLHEATLQRLHNVIDFGMDIEQSMEQPIFHGPLWRDSSFSLFDAAAAVPPTGFSAELIESVRDLGQPMVVLDHENRFESRGWWVGISIDPETGECQGRANRTHNGYALTE